MVVLKRLADAERDGDRIYAVIRGTGVASDGRAASLVNPDPGGQARAVRQAWQAAGLDPAAARIHRPPGGARHRRPRPATRPNWPPWPRCSGPARTVTPR